MGFSLTRRAALVGATLAAVVLSGSPPAQAAASTGSIAGRITTSTGDPATVVVAAYTVDDFQSVGWANTDENGDYRIDNLGTGSYFVEFQNFDGPEQYYHQKTEIWDADQVSVTAGSTIRVDEQLFPTGLITGVIRDRAGGPVPDLAVSAWQEDGPSQFGMTDADGRYRIPVLAGRYTLSFRPLADSQQEQYIPGKIDSESATHFDVQAGEQVTADDTLLATGSLSGRFTTRTGEPVVGTQLAVGTSSVEYTGLYAVTDGNGEFTLPAVLVGAYKVGFYHEERTQYYRGKLTFDTADPVEVHADEQTRILDSWLPTGSVRISAVDAETGAPITSFCSGDACSNGTGSVTISDLPQGAKQSFYVYTADETYFPGETEVVEVQGDKTIEVTVRMRAAGRITATVVDRASGNPVRDVCLAALDPRGPHIPDGYGYCTDSTGQLTIGQLEPGSYNLFADPGEGSPYGRQWVGPSGGTGDQRAAATVVATARTTVAAPKVLLDRAGTITGQVTDKATGAPVPNAVVSLLTNPVGSDGGINFFAGSDGRYRATGLGPYEWPLRFGGGGFASQWSGAAASRYRATPIKVTAGATATHNTALVKGVTVTGSVKNQDGLPFDGAVMAYNVDTGDYAGAGYLRDGQYSFPVLPSQSIRLSYLVFHDLQDYVGDFPGQVAPPSGGRPKPPAGSGALVPQVVTSPVAPVPSTGAVPSADARRPVAGAPRLSASAGRTADLGAALSSRRPGPTQAGFYLVPASGTLTVNLVVTIG